LARTVPTLPDHQLLALQRAYDQTMRTKQVMAIVGAGIFVACIAVSCWISEIDLNKFATNFWRFPDYFYRITPELKWSDLAGSIGAWFWGWKGWLFLLGETLLIAYVATVMGAGGALFLAFLAAENVSPSPAVVFFVRRLLEFCRTVPELVFALIFVIAFQLGPVPGVLALAIHTLGALGKQFYELIENIDMKPVDGLTASGATWGETQRFAVLPQVLPTLLSYGLLRFEINVRGAAILGFVGAGGIGQEFLLAVRKFYYSDVSAIMLMIVVTVFTIDMITQRIRHRLISQEGH